MKIAVVTPYHGEPEEWLRLCHKSGWGFINFG